MARKKSNQVAGVDPAYFDKQRESLRRSHRVAVFFNDKELAAIQEYCRRFKVSSRSALIRQSVMERALRGLEENHPTLF